MNQKNLNYEIETTHERQSHQDLRPTMNQKNLNYEIETGYSRFQGRSVLPMNQKNLNYEIET